MSEILKKAKFKKLICVGFESDIYQISSKIVYKHYPSCKSKEYPNRVKPWLYINKIDSFAVEKVYDYDTDGFVTDLCKERMGDIITYKNKYSKQSLKSIDEIENILKTVSHNDINPSNIMYNHIKNTVILIDWTQINNKPVYDFFLDENCLNRWKRCIRNRDCRWFLNLPDNIMQATIARYIIEYAILYRCFDTQILEKVGNYVLKKIVKNYAISEDISIYHNKIEKTIKLLQSGLWYKNIKVQNIMLT